ncbi:MAG: transporter substrate-binding protein [Herbaspirillum sp.]|jgi:NitT/TauT family transport system substrate-binding protein|nr:transporter substrate-binding protein [Herbaspirillum sp.]
MRSFLRPFVKSVIVCATAFALIGSAGLSQAQEKKAVLSQAFQSMLYLPVYVAQDAGFFKKHGLDVTKQTAGAPSTALSAVLSGSADFSLHGPEWTAIAASKGAPVNIIANVVNGAAVWIATTPDFKFTSIKDLKGETVVTGQMPTTSTSLFLKLLKENGMDNESVKMIQVQLGSEIGPLAAGQAKAAVMYEPGLDQAVARGMKVVLGFPKLYGPYAFSAITAKKDVDPDTAQRFVSALQDALVYMQSSSNQAAVIDIAKKEFPTLDPVVVESATKRMLAEAVYPKSVDISAASLEVAMATQIALGNLQAQPVYADLISQKFIKAALTGK